MKIINLFFNIFFALAIGVFGVVHAAEAATLRVNPDTGVYTVGKTFSVSVLLNTEGKPVNAADGQLSFNPRELQVTSVSRASSIFNLWTEEPTFSNTAGTVSFGGGSPTGYKGAGGTIVTATFKPLGAGTPKIQFKSGSILAADGLGTNILTSMTGGTYTVSAPTNNPEPEYIAPANTPKAPVVTSTSHADQRTWYALKNVDLAWVLPSDVVAVRTLLDSEPATVPTIVYDEKITEKRIENIDEGTSYFHIQFKNAEGWGKITHFKIMVDSESPTGFSVTDIKDETTTNAVATLGFTLTDSSPIVRYKIQIDGKDPFDYEDKESTKKYSIETLTPGYHTVSVEAFDSAGNSSIATHSFTIEALEKPVFTEYPTRINTEVIPAIKGTTVPNAVVVVEVKRASDGLLIEQAHGDGETPQIISDANGNFTYIPATSFETGVYSFTAIAQDSKGRLSEYSDEIRIIVEAPGYIVLGTMVIDALSVIVPLAALVLLLIFGTWYLWHKLSVWKRRVLKETHEAESSLSREFTMIVQNLHANVTELKESRKGKLTKAELDLIEQMEADLKSAQARVSKEIGDIEDSIT